MVHSGNCASSRSSMGTALVLDAAACLQDSIGASYLAYDQIDRAILVVKYF